MTNLCEQITLPGGATTKKTTRSMSQSTAARQSSESRVIPSRRVIVNDPSQLPSEYSTTPGGSIFSTTPGGTRIIYDRAFLLQCRNSPLTKSPPSNLPKIPGVTSPGEGDVRANGHEGDLTRIAEKGESAEEPQFQMDI